MIAILSLFGCGNVEDEQTVTVENPTVIVIQEENKEAVADIDKTQQQNASETSKEEPVEVETESQLEEETEDQSEAETEEAMKKDPEILHFVDVFGEEYEVEINENVAKTPYDNQCFKRDGDHLNYDDDKYSSRMGVDVSRHQGAIDWASVKNAGIDFAFIRIGYRGYGKEGTINLDQQFKKNIENAQKEGIDVGVYFFAQAINEEEAKEEAQFVISNLAGYELQLPVVYDPESILDAVARTDNVTAEQFTKNTEVFCSMIKEAGFDPMIYSNMLWEAYELDLEKLAEFPIWYADYEEFPQTPYMYEFWQYSNEGYISGISGRVDLNIQLIRK